MTGLKILGTGSCVPEKIVTNDDFAKIVDTSDEWISSRSGIKSRRHCVSETNTDLALGASKKAIEDAGIDKTEICCVIVATFTPDHSCPVTACLLQSELGLSTDMTVFDLNAGCTGFLIGLEAAYGMLVSGRGKYALVVGSEYISRALNYDDRSTCVLFGDGAGAAVVGLSGEGAFYRVSGAEGNGELIHVGGPAEERVFVEMDGKAVYRFATGVIPRCIDELLAKSGKALDDIDWFVFHQANKRIIDHVGRKLGIPGEKLFCNIERYGNTSAASIPIALDELSRGGRLKAGQDVLSVAFGGGLTWSGVLLTI